MISCPACGRAFASLTVAAVDHGAGEVHFAVRPDPGDPVDDETHTRFTRGQPVVFRAVRSRWRRFADVWRAARMAWRRP